MRATEQSNEFATEFVNYKNADDEVTRLKVLLEEANKKRSETVKQLHDKVGKIPFVFQGEYLGKPVCREGTWFLRL